MPSDWIKIRGTLGTTDPGLVQVISTTPCTKGHGLEAAATPWTLFPLASTTWGTWSGVNDFVKEGCRDVL